MFWNFHIRMLCKSEHGYNKFLLGNHSFTVIGNTFLQSKVCKITLIFRPRVIIRCCVYILMVRCQKRSDTSEIFICWSFSLPLSENLKSYPSLSYLSIIAWSITNIIKYRLDCVDLGFKFKTCCVWWVCAWLESVVTTYTVQATPVFRYNSLNGTTCLSRSSHVICFLNLEFLCL